MHTQISRWPSGISTIDTHYVRPGMAASHLMIEDGKIAFIDVGTTHSKDYLLDAVRQHNLTPDDVRYIIVTHIHLDHAGGAGILMQECPNATLVVHPKGARHMIHPEKLIQASIEIYGKEMYQCRYGDIPPIPESRVLAIGDGGTLDFQGRTLKFLDTPGHARHHFCIWDETSSSFFTGDTMGICYHELQQDGKPPFLFPTTTPAAFEPDKLIDSMHKLLHYQPKRFYLTHFGPVDYHPQTVQLLMDLISAHATIGKETEPLLDSVIQEKIANLLIQAYRNHTGSNDDCFWVGDFLKNDISLNASGVRIWAERRRRGE